MKTEIITLFGAWLVTAFLLTIEWKENESLKETNTFLRQQVEYRDSVNEVNKVVNDSIVGVNKAYADQFNVLFETVRKQTKQK